MFTYAAALTQKKKTEKKTEKKKRTALQGSCCAMNLVEMGANEFFV